MKIRSSFVSNSSASSFIVAIPFKGKTTSKITFEVDIEDYADYIIRTEKELIEYIKDETWDDNWREDDHWINIFEECKEALDEGKIIYFGTVTDVATCPEEAMLCHEGFSGSTNPDLTIIQDCDGY